MVSKSVETVLQRTEYVVRGELPYRHRPQTALSDKTNNALLVLFQFLVFGWHEFSSAEPILSELRSITFRPTGGTGVQGTDRRRVEDVRRMAFR